MNYDPIPDISFEMAQYINSRPYGEFPEGFRTKAVAVLSSYQESVYRQSQQSISLPKKGKDR